MKLSKRILKSKAAQSAGIFLIEFYIRLVFITSRRIYQISASTESYMQGKNNAIFSFWHGRLMMMPFICPPHIQMHILSSLHRDGILISNVMKRFRFSIIYGSSSKQGKAAFLGILRALKRGGNVSMTPDGPRGPHQVASLGIVAAAKLSGKPVLPVTFSARPHRRISSWDRFMVAFPFSRIIFCVGEPIMLDKSIPDEDARMIIEQAMNRLTDHADAALL